MACIHHLVLFVVGAGCVVGDAENKEQGSHHQLLSIVDTNQDQYIDVDEFARIASPESDFQQYDLNSDGRIDALELARSLWAFTPTRGKLRRGRLDHTDTSWTDWEMHAQRNGLPWGEG